MASLSVNEKSFVTLMAKSDEHARRGFDLLVKHDDPERFFDELAAAGLFDPSSAPAPERVDENSIRFPVWSALIYLLTCARVSDTKKDAALARSVMDIVRAVTISRKDDNMRANHITFWRFAEILGAVPNSMVTLEDTDLAEVWLNNSFDSWMVARALDDGAIKRFLASADSADWAKANRLLRHCLAIRRQPESRLGTDEEEVRTVVDPHWLKELIDNHVPHFGKKTGGATAVIFRDGVEEIYSKGARPIWSYIYRPAVEDNAQNHPWHAADNCFIEGLRDVLLAWSEAEPTEAKPFVRDLLSSDVQMLRRIGIYLLGQRWTQFSDLYQDIVGKDLFELGHIHEMFHLLQSHFEHFSEEQKATTVAAIRDIAAPDGEGAETALKYIQRRWLQAIAGTSYKPAATWLVELTGDLREAVYPHPDFNTYIESTWGPGPSPYHVEKLIAFLEEGTLIEKLNAFVEQAWRGASSEALVETLKQAVLAAPSSFARALPSFVRAKTLYQYGVVAGFRQLWDAAKEQQRTDDWQEIWPSLFGFFEKLFENPEVGRKIEGDADFAPSWLVSEVAGLLHSGVRDDNHAYPPALLARGWALLETLSGRADAAPRPDDRDPMTQALNTPKGRTIEAIIGHALRESRLADEKSGSHAAVWERLRPLFDRELQRSEAGNYEFLALAGASLANLEYLDVDWLRAHVRQIFPVERPAHFRSALGGFAYSAATRGTYVILRDSGVIAAALGPQLNLERARKALIQRLTLAYLWDEETLDGPRMSSLFERGLDEDLEAASWFLSGVRNEELSRDQVEKVIAFWDRCVTWAEAQTTARGKLFSSLASLAWSLNDADGRRGELLLTVAPYANIGRPAPHEFLKELLRLAEASPAKITEVLGALIGTYSQSYDYQGVMKSLITRLAELGCRPLMLKYCEQLRHVDGILELFGKLRSAAP